MTDEPKPWESALEAYRRRNPHKADEVDDAMARGPVEDSEAAESSPAATGEHDPVTAASEQIPLDLAAGRALRDQGVARANGAADAEWKAAAVWALDELIAEGNDFTADDIWVRVGFKPDEPRALGGILTAASKRGLIRQTGERRPSARPEHHAFPMAVWRPVSI